jgi:pimeloyl-ACP methyl ester carboxylesterase
VLCIHGLTRNGRDWGDLAGALARRFRVVCPDVAGRGQSEWLAHAGDYGYPLYLADMAALIARLDVEAISLVGTSMGGLIGMMLAAQPGTPIRRLVVNDIGPLIAKEGLLRIASYVGADPVFADLGGLEAYLREVSASFGKLSDAQWRHMPARRPAPLTAPRPRLRSGDRGGLQDGRTTSICGRYGTPYPTLVLRGAVRSLRGADAGAMTRAAARAVSSGFRHRSCAG